MNVTVPIGFTEGWAGQARRLPVGGLVDRTAPVTFRFDAQPYSGLAGDTLASALMANGVRLLGRSFKYHRPRGLVAAGSEEPNALVELRTGARREPNLPATVVELYEGLVAESQNRFPSLQFDLMAASSLFSPLIGAGFYYKTFMWPASFWERVYEPLIRRAAGLGRVPEAPDPDMYERGTLHADVLVVGAGPAGLAAALAAGRSGARVVLCDEDARLGGRLLAEQEAVDGQLGAAWAEAAAAELRSMPDVTVLPRTTVFGAYDHGTYGAIERVADHLHRPAPHQPRQTYWRIIVRRCVLASGAIERPLVFAGNDRPGIMLAGAARAYVNRYAVMPGRRAAVVTSGDDGWRTVADLHRAGIAVAAVIDRRREIPSRWLILARQVGARVFAGGAVAQTRGRQGLRAIYVVDAAGRKHRVGADVLAMAGGWNPALSLTCHMGGRPRWEPTLHAFVPDMPPPGMLVAGGAAGRGGLAEALADGARAGAEAASDCGYAPSRAPAPRAEATADASSPVWLMPRLGKAFVDFQHDVTAADIRLAHREGFRSVEHLKRYTTLGMATDQGKLGNVNGLALMAELTGKGIAATGTTMFRPPYTPVTIGAIAGHHRGTDFRPTRLTPAHDWAVRRGAQFMEAGPWLRAAWFPAPGETDWQQSVDREVLAVRGGAGVCDVSTLGKIELTGPDVGAFLDRLYTNTFSTLTPGRCRYGIMLREDGFVMDDGTTTRLGPDRWVMTTTTANAALVLEHMEFAHQVLWPELDVGFVSVSDQWAQFSIAGPRAREVLEAVLGPDQDVSAAALPHMGAGEYRFAEGKARVFRLSFSGE
ncbi:MAG: sarcosine oxidase subunit alpha family protein, partial [Acetobacteraceae bacterium]|nr:sarcosine oxidase subunit alpha family protein [Acetobacteraceae bacterium]